MYQMRSRFLSSGIACLPGNETSALISKVGTLSPACPINTCWRDVKANKVSQIIGARVERSRNANQDIAAQAEMSSSQRKECTALKVTVDPIPEGSLWEH